MRNYFKPGSWNAICDVCGFKFKSDQLQLRWDGLRVCEDDYEGRHPQDLIRVPEDNPSIPWARPDTSNPGYVCSLSNSRAIAGIGVAGCTVAGRATYTG